mmetsp:Transcript_107419/g.213271  ORF Transcript_107419/g.213271 Transcript_107419/m.213271 type:complete len:362 (-) Transcript_107419:93-1178(-)|eukprot:CAMPEP_0172696330 /NCGR_PEP_ID=MMETSP1074-20121228/27979_1 /TAXON_ID=2916 /ORGANISM="Ceratium fusus, Strain PA161109" /LENGTH=361 /DNA_ID=CAMNT_0013517065 /DNA_START=156 /DNA_END=1241 /DNA_ORIENTATION=+
MVGYDLEDKAYCMELTYNYDIKTYPPGTGLREIGIYVPDVVASTQAATDLGYQLEDNLIVGPDEYRFRLFKLPEGRSERFLYAMCRVGNITKSVSFYRDILGFSDVELPAVAGLPEKAAAVSYSSSGHPHKLEPVMVIFYEDGVVPTITPWEGRHAFALDAAEVTALHARYKQECPDQIMHDAGDGPIALNEKLGTLYIFIARDPDGYEHCYVSRETMLPSAVGAVQAYDPKALNWDVRDKRITAIEEAGKEVEALVASNPVVVFSKEWCPFCDTAKAALTGIGAKFVTKELENKDRQALVEKPEAFQEYLAAKTNMRKTVPKVFIGGTCIGGGTDVEKMAESGELLTRCVAAGAVEAKAA